MRDFPYEISRWRKQLKKTQTDLQSLLSGKMVRFTRRGVDDPIEIYIERVTAHVAALERIVASCERQYATTTSPALTVAPRSGP
jgi:hypothetical protein